MVARNGSPGEMTRRRATRDTADGCCYPAASHVSCPRVSLVRMQAFKGVACYRNLVGRVLQTLLSMLVVISIVFVLTRLSREIRSICC